VAVTCTVIGSASLGKSSNQRRIGYLECSRFELGVDESLLDKLTISSGGGTAALGFHVEEE
jgi:hypothetical protein